MSERFRNDLYYAERLDGAVALYPDGKAGQVEEVETESVKTIRGRRPDRPRTVRYKTKKLTQTALYDTLAEYRAVDKARSQKRANSYYDHDDSWTIDDMPDRVVHKFNEWQAALPTIADRDIIDASAQMVVGTKEELQATTLECPWCKGHDHQYACYGCGYARAYYKYPLIRLHEKYPSTQNRGEGKYDVPFDVAWFLQTNPHALSYETRVAFTHEGKMSATQVAVLHLDELKGTYAGHDPDSTLCVDKGDDLYGEIELPLATWKEAGHSARMEKPTVDGANLPAVIAAFQEKCALKVREQTDTDRYQELYDQFIGKLRSLGKGALTAVIQGRYWGMGDSGYELSFGNLPFERGGHNMVASSSTVRWLIEETLPMINEEKGIVDFRWEGGY